MPRVDLSQEGTNRDVQASRLLSGPVQRAALANAKLPFGMGDGMRLLGPDAQSVSSVMVVEGTDPGAAVTSLPLSFGLLEMGVGEPGVPVERPMVMRWVAASFMGDSVPPDIPWTLTLYKRPSGGSFSPAATFTVNTAEP